MTREEFWGMTMIEFVSACDGFAQFHGGQTNTPMSRDEMNDLMERYPD
tara:strand:+ start:1132 stop:1275 length:144 start_codon:yes stop_codon:yes gene_type:complete